MFRYRELVVHALSSLESAHQIQVVRLSLPDWLLRRTPIRLRNRIRHAWILLSSILRARTLQTDVVHVLDGSFAYVAKSMRNLPVVITFHDLIPALQQQGRFGSEEFSLIAKWLLKKNLDGTQCANRIIAVSSSTSQDLQSVSNFDPERIHVVYSSLPLPFLNSIGIEHSSWQQRRSRSNAYILHVGNDGFYKNRSAVLRIFASVRKSCNVDLMMAGSAPDSQLLQLAKQLGVEKQVHFVDSPDDHQLISLYEGASLFLFPSVYEGFGWPPLEAMSYGCPVVCSDAGSLPEVVGSAALTCPPADEKQMERNCVAVLQDSVLAESLIQHGYKRVKEFSFKRMTDGLREVYEAVLPVGRISI